jgi:DNA-binding GntR family transcriptional regulator
MSPPSDDARSPKRLTEEELKAIESALLELRRTLASGDFFEAERILHGSTLDASTVSRVISEVRRLRALVEDAAPYFDRMEAETRGDKHERNIRQLQVRLKAEVDGA